MQNGSTHKICYIEYTQKYKDKNEQKSTIKWEISSQLSD